jgi:hypothetical protein
VRAGSARHRNCVSIGYAPQSIAYLILPDENWMVIRTVAAVLTLEALGFSFETGAWQPPGAPVPETLQGDMSAPRR